jgi:SnoaL-like domain
MSHRPSLDYEEIRALQFRYGRLLDLNQPHEVAIQVFTEDAIDDRGRIPVPVGRVAIEEMFTRALKQFAATAHVISSVEIELDGDDATSSTYVTAWHWNAGGPQDSEAGTVRSADFALIAIYYDRLRRTAEGWRIAHRTIRPLGVGGLATGEMPASIRGFGGVPTQD